MKLTNLQQMVALSSLAAVVYLVWLGTFAVAQTTEKPIWKPGEAVEIEWKGSWLKGKIIETNADSYKVHYDGYPDSDDEIVEPSRVRASGSRAKSVIPEIPKEDENWTWKDSSGNVRNKAEFQQVLLRHSQWLASGKKEGEQANFNNADLTAAVLLMTNLDYAQMSGVNLTEAKLIGVSLNHADLSGANLEKANIIFAASVIKEPNLNGARFVETTLNGVAESPKLNGASFDRSKISGSLSGADLANAAIVYCDFTSSNLSRADLSRTQIFSSNFKDVLLGGANLTNALVSEGDWSDVSLLLADVAGFVFEPTKIPETKSFAGASNLEHITYVKSPDALTALRKNLKDNGFDDEYRRTTYAVKRRQNELRYKQGKDDWFKYLYYYLNLVFFDWTVAYGLKPERALIIVFYLWLIFALIYDLFIHFPGASSILLVKNRVRKGIAQAWAMRVRPRHIPPTARGWKYFWLLLKSEWRIFRISLFFSAMSALHLGYKDLDLGRWLLMLTKREYELRPKHWLRSLAGLQSLISFFLFLLWAVTEFIDPFD